jgi:hypothetical protein
MSMSMLKGELEIFKQNLVGPHATNVFQVFSKSAHNKANAQFVQQSPISLCLARDKHVSIAQLEK